MISAVKSPSFRCAFCGEFARDFDPIVVPIEMERDGVMYQERRRVCSVTCAGSLARDYQEYRAWMRRGAPRQRDGRWIRLSRSGSTSGSEGL